MWLERQGLAALPRYDDVHSALADWRRFSSARGVGVGELGNGLGESVIASDPPVHSEYRNALSWPPWQTGLRGSSQPARSGGR